jgi:hypothetical protein
MRRITSHGSRGWCRWGEGVPEEKKKKQGLKPNVTYFATGDDDLRLLREAFVCNLELLRDFPRIIRDANRG